MCPLSYDVFERFWLSPKVEGTFWRFLWHENFRCAQVNQTQPYMHRQLSPPENKSTMCIDYRAVLSKFMFVVRLNHKFLAYYRLEQSLKTTIFYSFLSLRALWFRCKVSFQMAPYPKVTPHGFDREKTSNCGLKNSALLFFICSKYNVVNEAGYQSFLNASIALLHSFLSCCCCQGQKWDNRSFLWIFHFFIIFYSLSSDIYSLQIYFVSFKWSE